jgi:hypothetical protein
MVTEQILSIEFEHGEPKYDAISKTCIALSAGEALPTTELFGSVKSQIQASSKIRDIAEATSQAFRDFKRRRIEDVILKQRGMTLNSFLEKQKMLLPEIAIRLDNQISNFKLNLSVLLVGVDESGAHLFGIVDPGHAICFDRLGFHAIGSGLPHAISTLVSYNFTADFGLKEAAYMVYEAKRVAEKAPGVGKELDMAIVDNEGIKPISAKNIETLDKAYKERAEIEVTQKKRMNEILDTLQW